MKKAAKYIAVAVLTAGLVLAIGAKTKADHEVREFKKIEKMAHFVKKIYHACGDQEATIVIATLRLKEMGEEGKVDGIAELDKVMAQVDTIEDPDTRRNLKNFVAFNKSDLQKKQGNHAAEAATLQEVIEANCAAGGAEKQDEESND